MRARRRRLALVAAVAALAGCPPPGPASECPLSAAEWQAMEQPGHSAARRWDELALAAIRRDLPQPTVHARNLFHLSAAMYDAWAAYDATARGVFVDQKLRPPGTWPGRAPRRSRWRRRGC